MPIPDDVARLIEHFRASQRTVKSSTYKETELRSNFLDPFFKALGWDVFNEHHAPEDRKEVVREERIQVVDSSPETGNGNSGAGYSNRAPDYSFRAGDRLRFFVEAKKPAVNLLTDPSPAFQVRRYGWSAKLPVSVLSDFEEFAVYDCRAEPMKTDPATLGRLLYIRYDEYADRWDEIAGLFARDRVLDGALDQWVETRKPQKGTLTVDAAFLREISTWREQLAADMARRNPQLSQRDLNYAVQMTIDRIIFLRICEDRGIQRGDPLNALLPAPNIYAGLLERFKLADRRYNSGLFHFAAEKGRADDQDMLTPGLAVGNEPLRRIISRLYYPDSPYAFRVIPIEILGQVYEQFLGKVIRLEPGHVAVVEEKPEVRKAGGVYYTPTYIVDYIVRHTAGPLLEGKTPKDVAGLRILDPACGSGSFLIGAYQFLLDWHLHAYLRDGAARHKKELVQVTTDTWRLTTDERKRILLNNIYGVDIDPQAVEVTKLSLLLKVLEGETESVRPYQAGFERILPDLGNNIKCGNSLIGPDFYDSAQASFLDQEERYRVNVFDWQTEFPAIMQAGGFDAVIGNPPWLMAGYYVSESLTYLKRRYKSAQGKFDLYYLFVEKGCELLSSDGYFGMIIPNKLFHTKSASSLRGILADRKWIRSIVDFGDEQLFVGATNYSCILLLRKQPGPNPKYTKAEAGFKLIQELTIPWSMFTSGIWHFEEQPVRSLFEKIEKLGLPLEEITSRFGTGVQSGADRLLIVDSNAAEHLALESALLRPILRGREVRRYAIPTSKALLIFPYEAHSSSFTILQESELEGYKNIHRFLSQNREKLEQRIWFGKGAEELSEKWYGMMYLDSSSSFAAPHILTPSLSNCSNFTLGSGDLFVTGTAGVTSIIPKQSIDENILYLLGLLNSALLSFYAVNHSPVFSGGYYKFSAPYLKKLPIRRINFDDPADKARHDQMVKLVERMLDLHRQLTNARTPFDRKALERQIAATDTQIDQLVYDLYGLTADERAIVEAAAR